MEGKTYGYVRVSTQVQNEARQLTAMREFGVPEETSSSKNSPERISDGLATKVW